MLGLEVDCISAGDPNAQIAIVSDYPAGTEKLTKVPYTGAIGRELWKTWQKYKLPLDKNSIYITNAIKRVVAHTKAYEENDQSIKASELCLWKEVLEYELEKLPNLKYILILGTRALEALTSQHEISKWRGTVFHLDREVLALASYNPAFVWQKDALTQEFSDPVREATFLNDCRKFIRLTRGQYVPHVIEHQVVSTADDFACMMSDLSKCTEPVGYDIEHWNKQTACIGFALSDNFAYVLPFCNIEKSLWTFDEELHIRQSLQQLFDTKKLQLIGQNCMTDATWLWYKDRLRVPPHYLDTMLAHHLLYSLMPHSLAYLVSQYTWHPFYKDDGQTWYERGDIEQFWKYNACDAVLTRYVGVQKLIPELKSRGLYDLCMDHVMVMDTEVIRATSLGILTDPEQIAIYDKEYSEKIATAKSELKTLIHSAYDMNEFARQHKQALLSSAEYRARSAATDVNELQELIDAKTAAINKRVDKKGIELNLNSPSMLSTLFKVMGLPGSSSTDKYAFDRWLNNSALTNDQRDILTRIQAYRKDTKFYSTYVKVHIDPDGRCRYQYNQTGTRTAPGRLSSSQNMWRTGTNMQNQNGLARAQFIADQDDSDDPFVFVYIDGEQAEARYVGWRARIQQWIDEFEYARAHPGELDCHRSLAARMFNKPYEEIPTYDHLDNGEPSERYLGKRARHGLNYRMGPDTFAIRTNIDLGQAKFVYDAYHRDTPELRRWWQELEAEARHSINTKGYYILRNAYGRELVLHNRFTKSQAESIVAFEPQSTVGDWMKWVWRKCHADERWPHDKARMILNVHDAVIAMARQSVALQCLSLMVYYAERPIIVRDMPLIIPASCAMSEADEIGKHRWSNLKKVKLT